MLSEKRIRPMLAQTVREPFDSPDHIYEIKWDGYRIVAYVEKGRIVLQNRNLRVVTASFPELAEIPKNIACKTAILDGEIVVLGRGGKPDFHRLAPRFHTENQREIESLRKNHPVTYVVFDILHVDGRDLFQRPLLERKKKLKSIVKEGPFILYSDHVPNNGISYMRGLAARGLEGAVCKRKDSLYTPGERSGNWLKVKFVSGTDAVIVGFAEGEGRRAETFGALVLGGFDGNGELRHIGNVGTGFTDKALQEITKLLSPLRRKKKTIVGEAVAPSPITWVAPRIVCEVGYASVTPDGKLRFPRFQGLRPDKGPDECTIPSS